MVQVIQGSIDREMSVLATSNLRPVTAQKRLLDAHQNEGYKRRRIHEDALGYVVEDLHPDRPLRSRERDDEPEYLGENVYSQLRRSAGEERRQSRGADPQVVIVKDSQRDTIPSSAPYVDEPKSESPEDGLPMLQDIPPAAVQSHLSPVLGDFNTTPKDTFIKPSFPASKARANSRQPNGTASLHQQPVRPAAIQTPPRDQDKPWPPPLPPNPYSPAARSSEPADHSEEINSTPPSAQPDHKYDHVAPATANTPQRERVATGKLRSPSTSAKKQLELLRQRMLRRGENPDLEKDPNDPAGQPTNNTLASQEQPQIAQNAIDPPASMQQGNRKQSPSVIITPTPQQRSRSRSTAASGKLASQDSKPPMSEEKKVQLQQRKAKEAERVAEQKAFERKREASLQRKIRAEEHKKTEETLKKHFTQKEANEIERRSRERSGVLPTIVATAPNSSAQTSLRRSVSFSTEVEYSDLKKPSQRRSNGDTESPMSILKKAQGSTAASSSPSLPPEIPASSAGRGASSISASEAPKAKPSTQAKVKRFSLLCESRALTKRQRPLAKQIFPPGYGPADIARLAGTPTVETKPKPEPKPDNEPGPATETKSSRMRQSVLPYNRDRSSSRPLEAELPTKAASSSQPATTMQAVAPSQAMPSSQDESIVISSDSEEEESDVSSSSEDESDVEETPKKAVAAEGVNGSQARPGASRSPLASASPGSSPPDLPTAEVVARGTQPNGRSVTPTGKLTKPSRSPLASARRIPTPSKQLTQNPGHKPAPASASKTQKTNGAGATAAALSASSSQLPTPSQILRRDDDYDFPSIKRRQEDLRRRRMENAQEEKRREQQKKAEAQRLAAQNAADENSSSEEDEESESSEESSSDEEEVEEVVAVKPKAVTPNGEGKPAGSFVARTLGLFRSG